MNRRHLLLSSVCVAVALASPAAWSQASRPIRLVVPHVLYEFADPALQERSSGQRALLRMGPENAAKLKAKMREVRAALVATGSR